MTYYEIDSTMWDDEAFVSYDDATRNLFQLLLTGPQRTALPGLQRGGMATLAETLRRPVEAIEKAFGNIVAIGKAGFDAIHRVIWVPNAPKYNQAKSPNQIRAWWLRWKEIPDCDVKYKHVECLREYAHLEKPTHREAWESTFGSIKNPPLSPSGALPDGFREPSSNRPEALRKGSPDLCGTPPEAPLARACADTAADTETVTVSEGELEGDEAPEAERAVTVGASPSAESAYGLGRRCWLDEFERAKGRPYAERGPLDPKEAVTLRWFGKQARQRGGADAERWARHWLGSYFALDDSYAVRADHPLGLLKSRLSALPDPPKPQPKVDLAPRPDVPPPDALPLEESARRAREIVASLPFAAPRKAGGT